VLKFCIKFVVIRLYPYIKMSCFNYSKDYEESENTFSDSYISDSEDDSDDEDDSNLIDSKIKEGIN